MRFSPLLKGGSVCGSKLRGIDTFLFRHNPVSFGFSKEMGLYLYKNGTVKTVPYSKTGGYYPPPTVKFMDKNRGTSLLSASLPSVFLQ